VREPIRHKLTKVALHFKLHKINGLVSDNISYGNLLALYRSEGGGILLMNESLLAFYYDLLLNIFSAVAKSSFVSISVHLSPVISSVLNGTFASINRS